MVQNDEIAASPTFTLTQDYFSLTFFAFYMTPDEVLQRKMEDDQI
jgi:hypothetical protein